MTVRRADCVQIESTPETRSFVEVTTTTDAISARQIAAGDPSLPLAYQGFHFGGYKCN